jgi:hypothetical protein
MMEEYQICGLVGIGIYFLALLYLVCVDQVVDHTESLLSRHNSLRVPLLLAVVFHLAYYTVCAYYGSTETSLQPTLNVFATYFISLAFIVFTNMWSEVMIVYSKQVMYWWIAATMFSLQSCLAGVMLVSLFVVGVQDTTITFSLQYCLYITWFPVVVLIVSASFMGVAVRLQTSTVAQFETDERKSIMRRLSAIMAVSLCCGICLVAGSSSMLVAFFLHDQTNLSPYAYFTLLQWLPSVSLLCLMLHFTKRAPPQILQWETSTFHGEKVRFNSKIDERYPSVISNVSSATSYYDLGKHLVDVLPETQDASGRSQSSTSSSFLRFDFQQWS